MGEDIASDDVTIDWGQLADQLGFPPNGSNSRYGQLALAEIIGERQLRDAVDWYVTCQPGSELARMALSRIQPPAARNRCVEIWRSSTETYQRRAAVDLLRVIATADDLELVPEFLADIDPGVQNWGLGVLEWLLTSGAIDTEEAEPALALADDHANNEVRNIAASIRLATGREAAAEALLASLPLPPDPL